MSVRKPYVYLATLTIALLLVAGLDSTTYAKLSSQPPITCGHPRGSDDAKRIAKKAWSKPYGPSKADRANWLKIKVCARTSYQRYERFPNIWKHYKSSLAADRKVLRLKLSCGQAPTSAVVSCIGYAGLIHGVPASTLYRIALCESHLNPYAQNPSGANGLFQFLASTWATTPYANYSSSSAKYASLGAAWMITQGRIGEWVCA